MATTSKGGRPSKGPRFTAVSRMPKAYEAKLERRVTQTSQTISDYIASLVMQDLDANDPAQHDGQLELLDLNKIA